MGPSIKYVTLEGEGSEKVLQFLTGGGSKSMTFVSCILKVFSYIYMYEKTFKSVIMKPNFESDVFLL